MRPPKEDLSAVGIPRLLAIAVRAPTITYDLSTRWLLALAAKRILSSIDPTSPPRFLNSAHPKTTSVAQITATQRKLFFTLTICPQIPTCIRYGEPVSSN